MSAATETLDVTPFSNLESHLAPTPPNLLKNNKGYENSQNKRSRPSVRTTVQGVYHHFHMLNY